MKVGEATYYYITNLQGDVMGLTNSAGTLVVSYEYSAYGVLTVTLGDGTTAENLNPLTYRGYVYDSETGLYYLQSRYYDPEIGRFINADGLISTGQGLLGNNMFAYCGNNPVNRVDPTGKSLSITQIIKAIVDAVIAAIDKCLTVHHDVPLYDQGEYNLCWAYCQIMVEDYEAGVFNDPAIVDERAKELAVEVNGANWNRGAFPPNIKGLPSVDNIFSLYLKLQEGPLYAYYWDGNPESKAHLVVITGVNLRLKSVYTNNPQGYNGYQTYEEFMNGYYVPGAEETQPLHAIFSIY